MKGDPGGEIRCPDCGEVRRIRVVPATHAGHVSTRAALRGAIRQHVYADHPGLGPRETSLLVDRAFDGALLGGEIAWTA